MKLFDKVLDAYYDTIFRVEDLIDTVKYKVLDLVDSVKGHNQDVCTWDTEDVVASEEPVKKKKKKTSKKKKK